MGTRKCQLVTVDGAEQRFLGSVWFYRSMHGCGSYQNSVEPLWHCPLSALLSTGTFPDVWVKPQPETELKVSEVRCLHHRLFGWRKYLRWLKNKTKKKDSHLHGRAYCKWQLTQGSLQDVDQSHGDENLLCIKDVSTIQHHVDAKHRKCNLGGREKEMMFTVWWMIWTSVKKPWNKKVYNLTTIKCYRLTKKATLATSEMMTCVNSRRIDVILELS